MAVRIVLMLCCISTAQGENATEGNDNLLKEVLGNINTRVSVMEEQLKKNERELEKTKTELLNSQALLRKKDSDLEERLVKAVEKIAAMKTEVTGISDVFTEKSQNLESVVNILRNPPISHACGSHKSLLNITSQTIPYKSLLYSSTNIEGGGLDIQSGVFTSPFPGTYQASWSLHGDNSDGEDSLKIFLRKNGKNIDESFFESFYSGPKGHISDTHLSFSAKTVLLGYITVFCTSLVTFDV